MTTREFSDEPTRVDQLVSQFLTGQSGAEIAAADSPRVTLAVGADRRDDCAVYDVIQPASLVIGSDYIRGPKFVLYEMGLLSDFDIGYYLVVANVSDIAAMGATPLGVLTVVRYPPQMTDQEFQSVMAGIHQACADFGTHNVGGDIGIAERLILSGTAIGVCAPGKVLTRHGARPGDLLCVTGACGLLGAAVAYFPNQKDNRWSLSNPLEQALLGAWRRPVARIAEGRILSSQPFATSCQDTSDGLKATIEQLSRASNVGFDVDLTVVPIPEEVKAVANLLSVDPLALAFSASSDFHLAFTLPPDVLHRCQDSFYSSGLDFTVIGEATATGEVRAVDHSGNVNSLPGVAWRHQPGDIRTLVRDV